MQSLDSVVSIVAAVCRHGDPVVEENMTPRGIRVAEADLHAVCRELFSSASTYFDMLSCIMAVDNGQAAGTMEVIYNLYSIPFDFSVALKVVLPRDKPEVDSVHDIWKTANWHEREAWDLLGVHFRNHPDLRRILLPADWEGHPLRKDYEKQEYYRGISLD